MKGLILDTSSNCPFLLWAEEKRAAGLLPLEEGENLSRNLGSAIKKFLNGRRPDFLAVGTGPGSFTGVRVGVAIAKALAFGWEIPLLGFPSLQSFIPISASPFAILSDARSAGLYCQRENQAPELLSIETAPLALEGYFLFSPHSARIAKRAHFSQGIQEAKPNGDALANFCFKGVTEKGQGPLAPFPLAYLDGKT